MDVQVQTIDGNGIKGDEEQINRDFITLDHFPRKKLMFSTDSEKNFNTAILEASSEISYVFHTEYLDKLVKGQLGLEILDVTNPSSSYQAIRKGFLYYLSTTGKYLQLRENLRKAVHCLLHQRSIRNHFNGFKTSQEYQTFLHDSYIYLLDSMNDSINSTDFEEKGGTGGKCGSSVFSERKKLNDLRNLLIFAQEALAQGDYDNAHRIHVQRISKSGDSDACWIDFALMWLSRGDDRLAEIAIREALQKNPNNIQGLLLCGLIGGIHRDESSISSIEKVLKLRPLCPEIHVLLGILFSYFGNESKSGKYYENARKLHIALTSGEKAKISLIPVKRSIDSQEQEHIGEGHEGSNEIQVGTSARNRSILSGTETASNGENTEVSKRIKNRKSLKDDKTKVDGGDDGSIEKKRHRSKSKRRSSASNTFSETSNTEDENLKSKLPTVVDQFNNSSRQNSIDIPRITKEYLLSTKPPTLGVDIIVTWNVTKEQRQLEFPAEFAENDLELHPLTGEKMERIQKAFNKILAATASSPKNFDKEVEAVKSKEAVQEITGLDQPHKHRHNIHLHHHHHRHHKHHGDEPHQYSAPEDPEIEEIVPEAIQIPIEQPFEIETSIPEETTGEFEYEEALNHQRSSGFVPAEEISDGSEIGNHLEENMEDQLQKDHGSIEYKSSTTIDENFVDAILFNKDDGKNGVSNENTVKSKRFGSEFLWTGHLLLRLRQFEFLDLILAKELSNGKGRSIEYLYLRSISLQLRNRINDSLDSIEEGLQMDPTNGMFWTLRGHAYYKLNNTDEAMASYERTLLLPHGRESLHLVYIRYGLLCVQKGQFKLAKRIFMKRLTRKATPFLWIAIGNASFEMLELDEAMEAFAEANKLDSTNPTIWGHLALVSLAKGNRQLAEQSYKWAIRFGLKNGKLIDDIKRLHIQLGFGNPTFPKIPISIPHEVFLERLGKDTPIELYTNSLRFPNLETSKNENAAESDNQNVSTNPNHLSQ